LREIDLISGSLLSMMIFVGFFYSLNDDKTTELKYALAFNLK